MVDPVTFDLGSALCATYLHCDLIWDLKKHQSINTLFGTKYEFKKCQFITFPWLDVDGGHTFWHWEPRNRLCSSSIDLVPIQFHIVRGAHCRKVEAWLPAGRCMSDCQIVRLSDCQVVNPWVDYCVFESPTPRCDYCVSEAPLPEENQAAAKQQKNNKVALNETSWTYCNGTPLELLSKCKLCLTSSSIECLTSLRFRKTVLPSHYLQIGWVYQIRSKSK